MRNVRGAREEAYLSKLFFPFRLEYLGDALARDFLDDIVHVEERVAPERPRKEIPQSGLAATHHAHEEHRHTLQYFC